MAIFVDIEKNLGDFQLNVKFSAENEILSLLGASGCGKSMTLKCIAGIEKPDRGRIVLDGVTLFDSERHINLSPQARHTGILFQNYALFPNMTVAQNLFAGTCREKEKAQRRKMVEEMLERFGLKELSGHYPNELSGGQQQRTALARILVSQPNILLLDEPFSALDSHLRFRLEREVSQLLHDFAKTVIFVSHDRDEVYRISDQIAVMNAGKIEVIGEKRGVFARPVTTTAAVLTGCKNISKIRRVDDGHIFAEDWGMSLSAPPGAAEYAGIRMHDIEYGAVGENAFPCRVVSLTENPFSYTVFLQPCGSCCKTPLAWEVEKDVWKDIAAEEITISINSQKIILLKG